MRCLLSLPRTTLLQRQSCLRSQGKSRGLRPSPSVPAQLCPARGPVTYTSRTRGWKPSSKTVDGWGSRPETSPLEGFRCPQAHRSTRFLAPSIPTPKGQLPLDRLPSGRAEQRHGGHWGWSFSTHEGEIPENCGNVLRAGQNGPAPLGGAAPRSPGSWGPGGVRS